MFVFSRPNSILCSRLFHCRYSLFRCTLSNLKLDIFFSAQNGWKASKQFSSLCTHSHLDLDLDFDYFLLLQVFENQAQCTLFLPAFKFSIVCVHLKTPEKVLAFFRCNETRVRITLQGTVSQCTFDQFGGCSKQTKMKKYFNIGASEPVSGQRKNCNKLRSAAQRTHLVVWSYWTVAGPQN